MIWVEPQLDDRDPFAWLGVKWRARCSECDWTGEPHTHPIDAGSEATDHTCNERTTA